MLLKKKMPKYITEDIAISSDESDKKDSDEELSSKENSDEENQIFLLNWMAADFSLLCFFIKLFATSKNINDFDIHRYQSKTIDKYGCKKSKHVGRVTSLGYLPSLGKSSAPLSTCWVGNESGDLWHGMMSLSHKK